MQNVRADLCIIFAEELAGLLVEREKAGRVGRWNVRVRPVLTVGGAGVKDVIHDEHGTVRGVVREHAHLIHHVIDPDDVAVLCAGFDGRGFAFGGFAAIQQHIFDDVFRLVLERAVVAVGHAVHVETHHFTPAGDDINAVAFDGGGREDAEAFPIVDLAGGELGHNLLPEERAGLFIEAHENAAVALVPFVARRFVVGADENFAACDRHVAVALRAELGDPLEVLDCVRADVVRAGLELDLAERIGQTALGRIHVADILAAPLRPVGGVGGGN